MKLPFNWHFRLRRPQWTRSRGFIWTARSAAAILLILTGRILYLIYQVPDTGPMGELVGADETAYISRIIDNGIHMITRVRDETAGHFYHRDAHAKTHSCVVAGLNVERLSAPLTQGLFSAAKSYKAWVRFSSGSEALQADRLPDARGMAIKVLGVPGKKLLEGETNATTQDFLMINNPNFFIRDVQEYARFTSLQADQKQFSWFFGPGSNPWNWKWREFAIGMSILGATPSKWPPRELLGTQFHSMTAYRLGFDRYIKFSARPASCDGKAPIPSGIAGLGATVLRETLLKTLAQQRACFDFLVQLQLPGKNMPVEDPTIEWREKDSPFTKVATLVVYSNKEVASIDPAWSGMNEDQRMNFCENLSMSPWHSLPEHEPVGALNRVRKTVYQGISRFRRCSNGVAFGEPKDDGSPEFQTRTCTADSPVPVVGGAE